MMVLNGTDNASSERKITKGKFNKSDGRLGWGQKIAGALEKEGKPLSTEQLIDLLEERYPVAEKTADKRVYYATQIFHACKREWIRLHYNMRRKGYYCLPEWYEENGNLPDLFQELMNGMAE